jgi:hypothetical protein
MPDDSTAIILDRIQRAAGATAENVQGTVPEAMQRLEATSRCRGRLSLGHRRRQILR